MIFRKTAIVATLFFASQLMAGHESGNGGGAIVCGSPSAQEVLLLDLWEAKVLRGLALRDEHPSVSQNLTEAITSLKNAKYAYVDEVELLANKILHQLHRREDAVQQGVELQAPNDAKTQFIKEDCKLRGIALYFDVYEKLFVDYQLYDKLSFQDKAALILHEAIYFGLRKNFSVSDSIAARGITGCAFASASCSELEILNNVPSDALFCSDDLENGKRQTLTFFAFKIHDIWRLQFSLIDGKIAPTVTYVDVPAAKLRFQDFYPEYSSIGLAPYLTRTSEKLWDDIGLKVTIPIGQVRFDDTHTFFQINGRTMIRCQKR